MRTPDRDAMLHQLLWVLARHGYRPTVVEEAKDGLGLRDEMPLKIDLRNVQGATRIALRTPPIARVVAAWRAMQNVMRRQIQPGSGLSAPEALSDIYAHLDDEDLNHAVDELERPH